MRSEDANKIKTREPCPLFLGGEKWAFNTTVSTSQLAVHTRVNKSYDSEAFSVWVMVRYANVDMAMLQFSKRRH